MRNVPKLRFKEFTDEWEEKRLGNYLIEFKEKIPYTTNLPKLTSSRKGLLFQKDYYDNREVKTETEYGLLPRGYFTYRHMSDDLIFKFNINDLVDNGAISKEYPVFTTKNFDSRFLYYLLNYGDDFKKFAIEQKQGGTRTRLYFKKLITFSPKAPILNEQNKIGKFIFNIDKRISITEEKLNLFNEYKKGIMHKLFNQELRFKDENGNDYPEWEEFTLGQIGDTYNGLTGKSADDFGKGKKYITYKNIFDNTKIDTSILEFVEVKENEKQNKVEYGDIFFTVSSETPDEVGYTSVLLDKINEDIYLNSFCFGYRLKSKEDFYPEFFRYVLRSFSFREKIYILAQGSTRFNLSKTEVLKIKLNLPCFEEQQKIADFLSAIDTKIEKISDELENLKEFKKG